MNQPPSSARQRSTALAVALYRRLLILYPASFRQRYGAQMLQVFRDSCREAEQTRGLRGLLALWLWTLADLLKTALAERLMVARLLARPVSVRLCGLITIGSGLALLLLYADLPLGFHLSFLAFLDRLDYFYALLLLDILLACCPVFGFLGLLLAQRSRGGRVLASLAVLAQAVQIAGWFLRPFYYTLVPLNFSWYFDAATALLVAVGLIGCGLLMPKPRWRTLLSCLPLLLGFSLVIEWALTLYVLLNPNTAFGASNGVVAVYMGTFVYAGLLPVRYLLWIVLGCALLLWKAEPHLQPQPATT